jgi:hypothetical protein
VGTSHMNNLYSALSEQMVKNGMRTGNLTESIHYIDSIPIGSDFHLFLSSSFPVINANLVHRGVSKLQFLISGFHDRVVVKGGAIEIVYQKDEFLDLVRKEHSKLFEWMIWNLVGESNEVD